MEIYYQVASSLNYLFPENLQQFGCLQHAVHFLNFSHVYPLNHFIALRSVRVCTLILNSIFCTIMMEFMGDILSSIVRGQSIQLFPKSSLHHVMEYFKAIKNLILLLQKIDPHSFLRIINKYDKVLIPIKGFLHLWDHTRHNAPTI